MWRGALAAALVFGIAAAPAQATVRKGGGSDAAGDETAGGTGADIVAVVGQSDDATGQTGVGVQVAGTPAGTVVGLVGTSTGTGCSTPYAWLQGDVGAGTAYWQLNGAGTQHPAALTVSGSSVVIVAADDALKLPFDCVKGGTSSDGLNLSDQAGAFDLVADTPAPTPTPTPSATPAPAPMPAPTTSNVAPVPLPKTAKLTASLGGVPTTIRRNRSMTLTLALANVGSKATGSVIVSVSRVRGVSVARSRVKVARFKPGQRRTLKLKLRLTSHARTATTLKATARSGALKASSSVVLRIGKARKAPTTPGTKKSAIAGTYWWRTVNHAEYGWDNRALYFVDDHSVYSGFPQGGLPATCTTPPAKPTQEIDEREGCLPYTWDEKTGALTIGDKTGTWKPGTRLVLDGNDYSATQIPAAGATFGFNELGHIDWDGLCGLIAGCTVTHNYFTLTPDGQFVLSHSTTATTGDPGSGPFTVAGSYPPDQHGTYQVLAGGKIHLAFADGTVQDRTFAVQTHDDTLKPDAPGAGVLLGEMNFYPDADP